MSVILASLPQLIFQAGTGLNGFVLQNATPTILTWNTPNDGNLHRFMVSGVKDISLAETGGAVNIGFTLPDGTAGNFQQYTGGQAAGVRFGAPTQLIVCKPGTAVTITQSALTVGAATVWLEIWGS